MFKEAPILQLLQVHPHSPENEVSLNFAPRGPHWPTSAWPWAGDAFHNVNTITTMTHYELMQPWAYIVLDSWLPWTSIPIAIRITNVHKISINPFYS